MPLRYLLILKEARSIILKMAFPAKDPRYHAYYNKKINRLSRLVIKEASYNCKFFNIYIGMGQKIIITLLFAGTIVGIFIIIYQASQSVIEVVTLKGRC
jgi:hypothetical protein